MIVKPETRKDSEKSNVDGIKCGDIPEEEVALGKSEKKKRTIRFCSSTRSNSAALV